MISQEDFTEALAWDDDDLLNAFGAEASDQSRELGQALLGPAEFERFAALLKTQPKKRSAKPGKVLILPGVTGSKLGSRRRIADRLRHVIWFNPLRVLAGDLKDLSLKEELKQDIVTWGVFVHIYGYLRQSLRQAGWDVEYFDFDWRKSLLETAAELRKVLRGAPEQDFYIVAHSMGGLLARAALTGAVSDGEPAFPNLKKIITLGTPHHGSYSPAPVLLGKQGLLRWAALFSPGLNEAELASDVFGSMPGFYELLPNPERFPTSPLLGPAGWPQTSLKPDPQRLQAAAEFWTKLAPTDDRFISIIGYGQTTYSGFGTGLSADTMRCTADGDGAVLLTSAEEAGSKQRGYIKCEHGRLPRDEAVVQAVLDLLSGQPHKLRTVPELVGDDRECKVRLAPKRGTAIGGNGLTPAEMLEGVEGLFSVVSPDSVNVQLGKAGVYGISQGDADEGLCGDKILAAGPHLLAAPPPFEIILYNGDITDAPTRVYAVGVHESVTPAGPAADLDQELDGALSEMYARSMISGALGWVNLFPATRRRLRADIVCLLGLGGPANLSADSVAAATSSLVRVVRNAGLEDIAMTLLGANSGLGVSAALAGIVRGALIAHADPTSWRPLRSLVICEIDYERFKAMVADIDNAVCAARPPSDMSVRVRLQKAAIGTRSAAPDRTSFSRQPGSTTVTLMTEQKDDGVSVRLNVLDSAASSTSASWEKRLDPEAIAKTLNVFPDNGFPRDSDEVGTIGSRLREALLFGDSIEKAVARKQHIVFNHDALSSRFPLETMRLNNGEFLALQVGMSRQLAANIRATGRWNASPQSPEQRSFLLVANPTEDLDGADKEAEAILGHWSKIDVRAKTLRRKEATRAAILREMGSGAHQLVHFAGHADFDPSSPGNGGIECADGRITASDVAGLESLPRLIFFNACESVRIRQRSEQRRNTRRDLTALQLRLRSTTSLAEALLSAGLQSLIGTYWPVGDGAASQAAMIFYDKLATGSTVGEALLTLRQGLFKNQTPDWANYMHFGAWDARL